MESGTSWYRFLRLAGSALCLAVLCLAPRDAEADRGKRLGVDPWSALERPRGGTWTRPEAIAVEAGGALSGTCGDSLLDPGEECDDGNTDPDDGCSASCLMEDGWTCTEPVPPAAGTNLVADGSFEAGTPSPFWSEASTAAGTPLCTVACGDDGSGPRSGDWWAWFGGIAQQVEEGSLSQSVMIPTTATTLEFGLEQIFCDSAADLLEVRIGETQVFSTTGDSMRCGIAGYSDESVDIGPSGFDLADGGTHTLLFRSQTFSDNGGVTDFFVDDVAISDNVPVPAQPSECFPLVPLACNGPPTDFDTPIPGIPRDWMVVDNEGTGLVWTDIEGSGERGNYTGGAGEAATVSSEAFDPAEFDTELWSAPFDLPALPVGSVALLQYSANYQNAVTDFLDLDLSTDGGSTWTNLLRWNEDHGGFFAPPGEAVSVDLTPYLGMSGLILRWRYYDPETGDFDLYAQIDDVGLACGSAMIAVTPASVSLSQQTDTQVEKTLTIENVGAGELIWSLEETSCSTPDDVPWLSAAPGAGSTFPGAPTEVTVTTDATGLVPDSYEATLCINSNDLANPTIEVPVTMTVGTDCADLLTLQDQTLVGGVFQAAVSITAGPNLVVAGPVSFLAGQVFSFGEGVELGNGFAAEIVSNLCP